MNANQNTRIKAVFFDMGGTLEDVYYDHKLVVEYGYPLPKSSMLLPKID